MLKKLRPPKGYTKTKTQVTIVATIKHEKDIDFPALRDGILIAMRDAFVDDLAVTGDIEITQTSNPIHVGLGNYLSNDAADYPIIIKKLKQKLKTDPNFPIDYIDEVEVWEKVQNQFTVKEFCDLVGISN